MSKHQPARAENLRRAIAQEAARIMAEHGVRDFLVAKRKAAERYADALEGESEVNRRTIARLEVETADLTKQLESALLRARQLEADVATAKVENDRLRSENMRLHAKLAEHGLDGDR